MNVSKILGQLGLFYVPFLFALCFHEFAHGWVARLKGDNTAELMGRLTMNPFVHMDIVGTVALPLMAIVTGIPFFGWAKPVPVNSRNLNDPEKDMFWIALAGPLSNVLLAFVATILMVLWAIVGHNSPSLQAGIEMANAFIYINLLLAVFNMIPLHPLDGGKVMARFLPRDANNWLEDNQMMLQMVLIGLFVTGMFKYLAIPIRFAQNTMLNVVLAVLPVS
ncbi:MAG: site-2 protease family protein [Bdellovibrionales bacterium]|nr:site-2 protease family protein [Bdellovibrionales bacterium]